MDVTGGDVLVALDEADDVGVEDPRKVGDNCVNAG